MGRTGKQLRVRSNWTQNSPLACVCFSPQASLPSDRCLPGSLGVVPRSSRTHLQVQCQEAMTVVPSVSIKKTAGED